MKSKCAGTDERLADLLLDPEAVPAKVRNHVDACAHCSEELRQLRATMDLLDSWKAPEPNPYFMTRLEARMRDERAAAPANWFERLRARFVYGTATHVRPVAAMAMTILLLVGGGTYMGIADWDAPTAVPGQASVVHDLQLLDKNAQLLDQLEAMSTSNENGD